MPDEVNLTNIVQITTEYDKFSYLGGNRKVSDRHLRNLIRSLDAHPELAVSRPVLVNKKFEIIDGQHRFEACRTLGLPVYYSVTNQSDIGTARLLNAHQRNWSLKDYLESYAYSKYPHYVKMKELLEEYPIPVSAMAAVCTGSIRWGGSASKRFVNGDFQIMKDKKLLMDRLNKLKDFKQFIGFWNYDGFVLAFWRVVSNPDYDHDRMMHKLDTSRQRFAVFEKQDSRHDYLREFERVYNFDARTEEGLVRLF